MEHYFAIPIVLVLLFSGCTGNAQPPQKTMNMSQGLCTSAGGRWNECGPIESCRDPRVMHVCPAICVQYCECGTGIGNCPSGYACTDYVPASSGAGQVGICKPSGV